MKMGRENIGLDLATIATIISVAGVLTNNCALEHIAAMWIWIPSNILFIIYFYGRGKEWWVDGLSARMICINYCVMLISGIVGLMQIYGVV